MMKRPQIAEPQIDPFTGKAKPNKHEQLARLILELGLDAAQLVFDRVRIKLERIS